jgi:hypothetical protein
MIVGTSERRESIYLGIRPGRKPLIGPYKDYLVQRWNEGYPGSDQAIVRLIAQFRKGKGQAKTFNQVDLSKETCTGYLECPFIKKLLLWLFIPFPDTSYSNRGCIERGSYTHQ